MIGLLVAVILIIALILFVLKIILNHTDFQTWVNILIITIILFTVVLSVYIILSKVNVIDQPSKTPIKTEQTIEETTKPTKHKAPEKDISEMSDEELSIMIAENYLTLKTDYEKQHEGEDGADYAKKQIMDEYGLTEEEWQALYDKFVQNGYLDKAAKNLNLGVDYLIKVK